MKLINVSEIVDKLKTCNLNGSRLLDKIPVHIVSQMLPMSVYFETGLNISKLTKEELYLIIDRARLTFYENEALVLLYVILAIYELYGINISSNGNLINEIRDKQDTSYTMCTLLNTVIKG